MQRWSRQNGECAAIFSFNLHTCVLVRLYGLDATECARLASTGTARGIAPGQDVQVLWSININALGRNFTSMK